MFDGLYIILKHKYMYLLKPVINIMISIFIQWSPTPLNFSRNPILPKDDKTICSICTDPIPNYTLLWRLAYKCSLQKPQHIRSFIYFNFYGFSLDPNNLQLLLGPRLPPLHRSSLLQVASTRKYISLNGRSNERNGETFERNGNSEGQKSWYSCHEIINLFTNF